MTFYYFLVQILLRETEFKVPYMGKHHRFNILPWKEKLSWMKKLFYHYKEPGPTKRKSKVHALLALTPNRRTDLVTQEATWYFHAEQKEREES